MIDLDEIERLPGMFPQIKRSLVHELIESARRLRFIEGRHQERCGCTGEACDLGSDLVEPLPQ